MIVGDYRFYGFFESEDVYVDWLASMDTIRLISATWTGTELNYGQDVLKQKMKEWLIMIGKEIKARGKKWIPADIRWGYNDVLQSPFFKKNPVKFPPHEEFWLPKDQSVEGLTPDTMMLVLNHI